MAEVGGDGRAERGAPMSARVLRPGRARPLAEMPGLAGSDLARLVRAGVRTVDDLWASAGDAAGRRELSARTGIEPRRLETWARRADLLKVDSIDPRQAALLDLAGVTSLRQLRRRRPESLRQSLLDANRAHDLVDEVPSLETLDDWISEAEAVAG